MARRLVSAFAAVFAVVGLTAAGLVRSQAAKAERPAVAKGGSMLSARYLTPPRKVVVGTLMNYMWGEYPGLEGRLKELAGFVDTMAAQAQQMYGAGLDLVVLPECAVTGEMGPDAAKSCVPLEGKVLDVMGAAARRHHTYLIVPLNLADDPGHGIYSNAAVLLDRQGKLVGMYRKVHLVAAAPSDKLENGLTPGKDFPVFDCDFGKLGIQICYDVEFDDGWEALGRKGAEIVAWTTQSPQMIQPRWRAAQNGYYVVSSTWRNNSSVFDPTGDIIAQTRLEPSSVLVTQVDLSYAIVGWQPTLGNGKAFADKYGPAVGFRYHESEDRGLFWSNDPNLPIGDMVHSLGLETFGEAVARNRKLQDRLRGGPPKTD